MKTVELIYFNAGGGHRAAALALQQAMLDSPWRVRLVNLVDMIDPQALFHKTTGVQPEDVYNRRLSSGFTIGLTQELKVLQFLIRLGHNALTRKLRSYWIRTQPDLVVSLIPNFNRSLCQSVSSALPGVPFVTVLTDMADHPPSFWIEPDQPQHVVCGTEHAARQALAAGCAPQRIHRTSGMIIHPSFYATSTVNRVAERRAVGLDTDQAVGVVLFGGLGSDAMKSIATKLPDTPLILMCGHNAALAHALRSTKNTAPRIVVEFTQDVAYWMRLADFFIGKPGPASLSEAVHLGLPVIVTRNAWTMPQERWNTEWVVDNGLGIVLRNFRHVRTGADAIVGDLPHWQSRVRAMHNQAVFEVPQILAKLLDQTRPCGPRADQMSGEGLKPFFPDPCVESSFVSDQ